MTDFDPAAWTGRTEHCIDHLDPSHAGRVALSLGQPVPAAGAALPPLWHWAFFVQGQPAPALGPDGHPRGGDFLPPTGTLSRMWAGGRLEFHQPLRIGVPAQRRSVVRQVQQKNGRTGPLLFVTVAHEYRQDEVVCLTEEQDIVYRQPAAPRLSGTEPAPPAQWQEQVDPDPVQLFRYSAVTFNGHRIHYDMPYARDVEGYPGLVVHGPLIATRMVQAFLNSHPGARVTRLAFRGMRPLIAPRPFRVAGHLEAGHAARLWAEQDGMLAHTAEIGFAP